MPRFLLAAVLAVAGGSTSAGCGRREPPPGLPGGGRIAFVLDRNVLVDRDILVLDDPNKEPWELTAGGGTNEAPGWSPEGRTLLFNRNVDGLKAIFVWEEGGGIERLCSAPYVDMAPSWAPDGRRFAVMSLRDDNWEIYSMRADGTGGVQLTEDDGEDKWPAWSPDGASIAFVSTREGSSDLWALDVESLEVRRLTSDRFTDHRPSWSPDGSRIAWSSERDGKAAVFVMDASGKNVRRLTSPEHDSLEPAWSPDGAHLVYVGSQDGYRELYVIDAEGRTAPRRVTRLRGTIHTPAWGRRPG
jgi:tol-pal system beta propeller repeat protein TolB